MRLHASTLQSSARAFAPHSQGTPAAPLVHPCKARTRRSLRVRTRCEANSPKGTSCGGKCDGAAAGGGSPAASSSPTPSASRRAALQLLTVGGLYAAAGRGAAAADAQAVAAAAAGSSSTELLERQLERRLSAFTLPNGLRFLVLERHTAPIASFHILADVGAYDEVDGQTGAPVAGLVAPAVARGGNWSGHRECVQRLRPVRQVLAMRRTLPDLSASCSPGRLQAWRTSWSTWRSRGRRASARQTTGGRPCSTLLARPHTLLPQHWDSS